MMTLATIAPLADGASNAIAGNDKVRPIENMVPDEVQQCGSTFGYSSHDRI